MPHDEWADEYPTRELGDGRFLQVYPLTFDRARLCIGQVASPMVYDDCW